MMTGILQTLDTCPPLILSATMAMMPILNKVVFNNNINV
jgi:hypothetical protein